MILGGISVFKIAVMLIALGGFFLARHIWLHKRKAEPKQPLVCPLNFHCDPVIHSDFSRFLGVPVEVLGMLYYGLITIAYAFGIFLTPDFVPPIISLLLISFSVVAFLFSLYLTFVQAFVLKQWCSWCLVSAGLCFLIFGLSRMII